MPANSTEGRRLYAKLGDSPFQLVLTVVAVYWDLAWNFLATTVLLELRCPDGLMSGPTPAQDSSFGSFSKPKRRLTLAIRKSNAL